MVGDLRLEDQFGKGTFGVVYGACDDETGERDAIKVMSKDRFLELEEVSSVWKEINFLSRLKHPNIVLFKGVLHGPNHIFIRMELVGRYNLFRGMCKAGGVFRIEVVKDFMRQMSSAIVYIQHWGVSHRDLKPENIAMTDCLRKVKLLDFGSAATSDKFCSDVVGTMPFMAPEVVSCRGSGLYDPTHVDVWSLGIVLLEMLCGFGKLNRMLGWEEMPAADARCGAELTAFFSNRRLADDLHLNEGAGDTEEIAALLSGMLNVTPAKRLTATQVSDTPWLQE